MSTQSTAGGWTPMMLAAESQRDPEIIRVLVAAGADPNAPSSTSTVLTPLGWAIHDSGMGEDGQPPEVVEALLQAGADPNAEATDDAKTALLLAAFHSRNDLIPLLVDAGAKLEARDRYGDTALHIAVSIASRSPEVMRTLLEAGADIEARTAGDILPGRTVLMVAACAPTPNPAIVRELLARGADPLARTDDFLKDTALFVASHCGGATPEIVHILLEAEQNARGASEQAKMKLVSDALMVAARYSGNPDVVRALLEAGGDPEAAFARAAENAAMRNFDWSPYLPGQ